MGAIIEGKIISFHFTFFFTTNRHTKLGLIEGNNHGQGTDTETSNGTANNHQGITIGAGLHGGTGREDHSEHDNSPLTTNDFSGLTFEEPLIIIDLYICCKRKANYQQ